MQFFVECSIPEGCQSESVPRSGFGEIIAPTPATGLLLHVNPTVLDNLAFRGRFGGGGNYLTNGTELPIVRETQFVRTTIHFPYVTLYDTPQEVRATLRVYGPDAVPGTTIRIEVRSWDNISGDPRASEAIELSAPPSPTDVPILPAFAQISLNNDFPFQQLQGSSFNISVVPLPLPSGEVPRIWAFISTTENGTQLVTVQTPQ